MDMTFIEFLKAISVLIWIVLGFIIFYEDIMMVDVKESETQPSQNTETVRTVEKIVYVNSNNNENNDSKSAKKSSGGFLLWLKSFKKDPVEKQKALELKQKQQQEKAEEKRKQDALNLQAQQEKNALLQQQKLEQQKLEQQKVQAQQLASTESSDPDEVEDEKSFEDVVFFKGNIQVKKDFYESLSSPLQKEFKSYFMDDAETHLVKELQYEVGKDNTPFFQKVFNYIYTYRHVISPELLDVLQNELLRLGNKNSETETLLYEAATRVSYFRRKDKKHLALAETWATKDVELQRNVFNPKKRYVYSYVRLSIMLEKQGRIDEAIALVEDALSRELDDKTKGNYKERLVRLKGLKKPSQSVSVKPLKEATLKTVPLPVVVESDEQLEQLDENAMEDVQIFKAIPKSRNEFYNTLTDEEKKEFKSYFIDEGDKHLVKGLQYTINGSNDAFFYKVFNYIYEYRKTISASLLNKIYQELTLYAGNDDTSKSLISEAAVRTLYYNRAKKGYLETSIPILESDIKRQNSVFNVKKQYVYSYLRYAIILEKQGRIEEAIALVEDALTRELDDRTKGNYKERLVRLKGMLKPVEKEEPEEEDVADEADLENIQIFKNVIEERKGFYESLTSDEQSEFRRYFVDKHEEHLALELQYEIGKNNGNFFMRVFNYIYRYRRIISYSLLVKLSDELQSFSNGDPQTQTLLYEAAIRVAYFRRKSVQFLDISQVWAQNDVIIHQTILNSKDTYVYSFTRLAIILEKKKAFKEALALVEDALKRQLNDKTRTGYQGRKIRLIKKLGAAS